MKHYSYTNFTLQARKARAKLYDQIDEAEKFGQADEPNDQFSEAKNTIIMMDKILRTIDPEGKEDLMDVIEDLSVEGKTELAELLGIKYQPALVQESEDEWE